VRTDTAVGENSVSMASASVKMAEQIFPSISDPKFVAQFLRALVCTVGNGNELGIFGGKISGHQLNHFACTDKEDVQIGNGREDLLCHFDRCRSHGDGVFTLITVANRTHQRAQELCDKLGVNAEACLLNELPDILHDYDVVVSSTASQLPLVGKGMVERALKICRTIPAHAGVCGWQR
jgi:glutamyl-tRNA reductase